MSGRLGIVGAGLAVVLLASLSVSSLHAADGPRPMLSPEQRKELAALMAEFRKVRPSPEKRLDVIDRAGALSPLAVNQLLEILNKEMGKQLADYRQQFMKTAGQAAVGRIAPEKLQEIGLIRGQILALAKQEGLTKEQIVQASDPGLARLKELILINRQEILQANPRLPKMREQLQVLGQQWEKCATLMLKDDDGPAEQNAAQPVAADAADSAEPPKPPSFDDYLAKEEEIAVALAMPMDAATRQTLAFNSQIAPRIDPEEARCILDVNLTRNLLGLNALRIDVQLVATGRDHSSDMERLKFFAHDSPLPGKAKPWDRAKLFGTTAAGENIAMGTIDGAVANEMWWHSPGHHRNMLNADWIRIGVGRHGKYWTELFGR